MTKYKTGLLGPDPIDERDLLATQFLPKAEKLPETFNLKDKMTSIQTQFYGSCTSHSVDGVKEYQETLEEGFEIKLANRFIYHNTKVISGLWDMEGDYLRNAVKAVEKYGVPLEHDFIDDPERTWKEYVTKVPSDEVYKKALKYKAKGYLSVNNNIEAFRNTVFENKSPIVCGLLWYKNFKTEPDGKLPLPSGAQSGGHAISYIGWEGDKEWFRNSWGMNWGKDGYFYILNKDFSKYNFWSGWTLYDLPNDWMNKVKSMYKLIKLQNTKDIYAVNNNTKHLIINKYCFEQGVKDEQWLNWENITSVNQNEFDNYKLGDVLVRVPNE